MRTTRRSAGAAPKPCAICRRPPNNRPEVPLADPRITLRRQGLGLAFLVIVLDQITKWWVLTDLMNPPRMIEVLPFANLVLVWNRGVSFGLFNTASVYGPWILSALAIGVSAVLAVWLFRGPNRMVGWGIGLILGGALGNVIDRLVHGAVVDFVDLHVAGAHWPAFNVADSAITIGAGLLILDSLFHRDKSS
ncbi:MAG: signal peptidase II [Rhodospirillaceae bacterium]|nr:signal peptidase II [Magnetovibrio sp.]MAY67594.1 signal peptidase II [Rhodospirillaceae bacterium]